MSRIDKAKALRKLTLAVLLTAGLLALTAFYMTGKTQHLVFSIIWFILSITTYKMKI